MKMGGNIQGEEERTIVQRGDRRTSSFLKRGEGFIRTAEK